MLMNCKGFLISPPETSNSDARRNVQLECFYCPNLHLQQRRQCSGAYSGLLGLSGSVSGLTASTRKPKANGHLGRDGPGFSFSEPLHDDPRFRNSPTLTVIPVPFTPHSFPLTPTNYRHKHFSGGFVSSISVQSAGRILQTREIPQR